MTGCNENNNPLIKFKNSKLETKTCKTDQQQ